MADTHIPVLLDEVLKYLDPKPGQHFIDGTFGGGGHTAAILQKTEPDGIVYAFDRDPNAIDRGKQLQNTYADRLILIHDRFSNIDHYVDRFHKISGILLDLGYSSYQIEDPEKGMSFLHAAPLDMRMGAGDTTAADIINQWKEEELAQLFKTYGEEPQARKIAHEISSVRKQQPIERTDQLVELIERVYQGKRKPRHIHVATKVFQALRMAVNEELQEVVEVIPKAIDILVPGGRLAIISFHSGEDRIVKHVCKDLATPKYENYGMPNEKVTQPAQIKIITKKPIEPTNEEKEQNPRSRSAKLRIVEKI